MRTLEEQCQALVHRIKVLAAYQYRRDKAIAPVEEYVDAGFAALSRCWERYDPARQIQFSSYAEPRIHGAIRDAAAPYRFWRSLQTRSYRQQREKPHAWLLRPVSETLEAQVEQAQTLAKLVTGLPAPLQPFASHTLAGGTQAEYAATHNQTAGQVRAWLLGYRRQYQQSPQTP